MKILKGYTKNQYCPKASIVERYIAEEAIEFCSEYMTNAKLVGLLMSHQQKRWGSKGSRGSIVVNMGLNELNQAHLYILNNTQEVIPYIAAHKEFLKDNHPKMSKKQLLQEHNNNFLKWFINRIFGDDNASKMLRKLENEPNQNVRTWKGYDINNYSFYTKS